nr:hypothetical protein [Tanacetum cinerariifolium]
MDEATKRFRSPKVHPLEKTLKPKYIQKKADSNTSPKQKPVQATKSSHAGGLGNGVDTQSKVLDEQHLKMTGADERTDTILGVLDVPIYEYESEKESLGNSEDEDEDDENDSDDINNEEMMDDDEDDEVTKELYEDVNVNLGNEDTEMADADRGASKQQNVSLKSGFEQVEEDAHVTITSVLDTQKANEHIQSSSVSSDFTRKLLNLENPSPADNEIALLMETFARHTTAVPKITSGFTTTIPPPPPEAINNSIQAHSLDYKQEARDEKNAYIELVDTSMRALIKEEVNTQLPQILPQAVSDFANLMIEKNVTESIEATILIDKMEKNKSYDKDDYKKKLYDALVKSYNTDKDLFDSYGEVFSLKKSRDDRDKDQDPSVGPERGINRRKSNKDAKSSKDSRSKENKASSTPKDASQSQHNSFGKSTHVEEPSHTVDDSRTWISQVSRVKEPRTSFDELIDTTFDFFAFVLNQLNIKDLTQEILVGPAFELLKGTYKGLTELQYHLEECSKATTERPDWHNPKGKQYPVDLNKHLLLIRDHRGCQIIPHDFFINNDLEYLKGKDLSRRYSTSVTKRNATTYEIKWIENLGFATNITSSKDVYSRKRIIVVTRLLIMKKYDNGHLEEIEVCREDPKLYKFREGNKDAISSKEEMGRFRQMMGSGYDSGYRQAALCEEVDAKFREVRWWKRIRERPHAAGTNNMILSYCVLSYFSQNRRDLPKDIPLDSVEVLSYEKRSKSENKGKVPTKMELVLEQTQQGTSYEVSVSTERVEELKKVKINGEKKEALLILRQKPGQYICYQELQRRLLILKTDIMDPVM